MIKRTFLKFLFFLSFFPFLYSILRFMGIRKYRPPEEIIVPKILKSGEYLIEKKFVIFNFEENLLCVSRRCTHLGCIINYDHQQKMFICPCHKSRFKWDGKFIEGPAKKDLVIFEIEKLEDNKGYMVKIPRQIT